MKGSQKSKDALQQKNSKGKWVEQRIQSHVFDFSRKMSSLLAANFLFMSIACSQEMATNSVDDTKAKKIDEIKQSLINADWNNLPTGESAYVQDLNKNLKINLQGSVARYQTVNGVRTNVNIYLRDNFCALPNEIFNIWGNPNSFQIASVVSQDESDPRIFINSITKSGKNSISSMTYLSGSKFRMTLRFDSLSFNNQAASGCMKLINLNSDKE